MVLTLNNAKSALISLLDGCDEFVAIDDIDVSSSSILCRKKSSSFGALDALDADDGGSTKKEKEKGVEINNQSNVNIQINWNHGRWSFM